MALQQELGGGGVAIPWGKIALGAGVAGGAALAVRNGSDDDLPNRRGISPITPERPVLGQLPIPGGAGNSALDALENNLNAAAPPSALDEVEYTPQSYIDSSGAPFGDYSGFTGAESNRFGAGLAPPTGGSSRITPLQLLQGLYDPGIDDETFRAIQEDLYMSGYFGNVGPEEVLWGNRNDQSTFDAWRGFVDDVATRAELGDTPNWWDILQAGVDGGSLTGRSMSPVPEEEELEPGTVFQLSDPQSLAQVLQSTAQRLIGRDVSGEEQRLFVAAVHELQRSYQEQIVAAREPGSADIEVSAPDVQAQAESTVGSQHPDEVGAARLARQVGVLSQLLGGGFRG